MVTNGLVGANAGQTAAHNRRVVMQAIHRFAPLSRTELARQSGLTKQAIARIVDRLLDEGLIVEARRRHGFRGQPAIELEINPDGCYAIGANIDRDYLTIVAIDATGKVCGRIHYESYFILPDEFTDLMEDAYSSFLRRKVVDEARLAGIGLAIPDWLADVPVSGRPEAYARWRDFDVRSAFRRFTAHPVFIDNDANAAALGELDYGLGTESRSFLYILANACLGGGLVLDGVCYRGASSGVGGEIGWLPMAAPGTAMDGQVQPLGHVFSLFNLYAHLKEHGIAVSEPAELLHLDETGRAIVSDWLHRVSVYVAEAVYHAGLVIDPDAVLIGGRLPIRLIDELLYHVHDHLAAFDASHPSVHRAAGSEDAAALGAAVMPLAHKFMLDSANPVQLQRTPLRHMTMPVTMTIPPLT